jgi:hypothetical protein
LPVATRSDSDVARLSFAKHDPDEFT